MRWTGWPSPTLAGFAAASVALLIAQLHALIASLYANADNAATLLLAGGTPTGTVTKLGDHPFFEAWWFMRLTAGLPSHIAVWQAAPFAVAAAGIAAVVLCVVRVARPPAGWLAATGLLAMSGPLRAVLLVPEARVGLLVHAGVLCWVLLAISRRQAAGGMTRGRWALAALGVVAFTGPGLTDTLLLPAAVLPFVAAAWLGWHRERTSDSRAMLTFALGTAAAAYGVARLLTHMMADSGVLVNGFAVHPAPPLHAVQSIVVTLHLFAILAGGHSGVGLLAGCLAVGGLVAVVGLLWRDSARLRARPADRGDRARLLFTGFWASALLLSLGAVAGTSMALDHGVQDAAERYLLGAWCATVALLAASARTRRRVAVIAGATCSFAALMLASNLESVRQPWQYGPAPQVSSAVARFVLAHGATVGYGGYWDVMPIGLAEQPALRTVPIVELGSTGRWAGHFVAANSGWFSPGGNRSFLVADTRPTVPYVVPAAPAAFGPPAAVQQFGPLIIYIYDHDLANDLRGTTA